MPLTLRAYLAATHGVPLVAKRHLKKRVARGKEHPTRWTEKLGQPTQTRPKGKLIWLHAVGLGEVLSLRGLITFMADQSDANFLVTSSTAAGAKAFARNAPPRTIHQFLPLDAPPYRQPFLDHWQPDLCVWAEQDIWPGFVCELVNRNIPQALIAARMNAKSHSRHKKTTSLFTYIYNHMRMITAQDDKTKAHLQDLRATDVKITGTLKSSAPPLDHKPSELAAFTAYLKDRFVWITAPAHQADIDLAVAAHTIILKSKPTALLIIAPRFPDIALNIPSDHIKRSHGDKPKAPYWIIDTLGELGLMYRLATAALIGGTNDGTEGHNPWEAVALETAIFHGPRTANFQSDFITLDASGGTCVNSPQHLATELLDDLAPEITAATTLQKSQMVATQILSQDLLALTAQDD